MAFAITQSCCSDASCVSVCPVNCIHPTPDEPDFGTTEMLYIDARTCIDCGACADACPVDAILPVDRLVGPDAAYADINRDHYLRSGLGSDDNDPVGSAGPVWGPPVFPASLDAAAAELRVAVVGSGPAASYTAAALLTTSARVTMLERLPVPGGLIRFGVAPDHQSTKAIADRFATVYRHPRLDLVLNVEVGVDVTHEDLMRHHDAVVYAVGASADRSLGVPGEQLPGSLSARTFVGWYNAQPEIAADRVDLGAAARGRAVVVGNGNVALDMARVLLADPGDADQPGGGLGGTDIADHALAQLRSSTVTEVVLVARRGPAEAAYTLSELRPLLARTDLDVVLDAASEDLDEIRAVIADAARGSQAAALQGLPVDTLDWTRAPDTGAGARRRLVLRFASVVRRLGGDAHVESVQLARTATPEETAATIVSGLVLRSVGYRSEPQPGLPFDPVTHTVPHHEGRVIEVTTGSPMPGAYVVGWIKRGPSGGIGSNRTDAAETVTSIVRDANSGAITTGRGSARAFRRLVRDRRPDALGRRGLEAIDRAERDAGRPQGRPRVKLTTVEELVATARRR